jgi:hypothetical protein
LTALATTAGFIGGNAVAQAAGSSSGDAQQVATMVATKSEHQRIFVIRESSAHSGAAAKTIAYVDTSTRTIVAFTGAKLEIIDVRGHFAQNEAHFGDGGQCWLEVQEPFAVLMATGWAPWPFAPSEATAEIPYQLNGEMLSWRSVTARGRIEFDARDLITGAQTYDHDSRRPTEIMRVSYPRTLPASLPKSIPATNICRTSGP